MPRTARAVVAGHVYHVLNRGNARARIFHDELDYRGFLSLLRKARNRFPVQVFAACLMPNHFHFVASPETDVALSEWMHWLTTSHAHRYHRRYGTIGHVYQGRFKHFPIQCDTHLLTVLRYVERNPVRANLVLHARQWKWGSLAWRHDNVGVGLLTPPPVPLPRDWAAYVNSAQTDAEVQALRNSVRRGAPFGESAWKKRTASELGLEFTLRAPGRPRKGTKDIET